MSAYRRRTKSGEWRWHYRVMVRLPDGSKKRIAGTPSLNTKSAAVAAERAHVERVLNPKKPMQAAPAFDEFAKVFLRDYVAVHNKPSEAHEKGRVIRFYLQPFFKSTPLDRIDAAAGEKLKAHLLKGEDLDPPRPREPKTVNNILTVLAKLLRYAQRLGQLRATPMIEKLRVNRPAVEFLDFDEYATLVETAKSEAHWHLAILLAGDAGLRRGELRALRQADWERRSGRVVVQRSVWKGKEGGTKGWRARAVPTTTRLAAALQAQRHLRGDLFLCDADGDAFTEAAYRKALPRLCLRAGIKSVGWHDLRHTFCSHLAMRGAPAKAIQELAGHADLTTTMRYMHLTPDSKDAAIRLLEAR